MGPEGGRRPSAGGVLCGLTAAVVAKVLLLALNLVGGILACSLIGAPPPPAPPPRLLLPSPPPSHALGSPPPVAVRPDQLRERGAPRTATPAATPAASSSDPARGTRAGGLPDEVREDRARDVQIRFARALR